MSTWLLQGGFTLGQCLQVLMQSLSGLQHLHRLGILHRDLRAANVLLGSLDPLTAMLTDFGVSRILSKFSEQAGTMGPAGSGAVDEGTVRHTSAVLFC